MTEGEDVSNALLAALSAIDSSLGSDPSEKQLLIAAKMRGLMRGYAARWDNAPYQIDGVEEMVESDLWNPSTRRKSRAFRLAGKLDVKCSVGDSRVIIDHKTTSEDVEDPLAPYWRQLVVEAQPSHYALLEWLNGRKADEIVWDVIRKPSIRPANVTKKDQADALATGLYFGSAISEASARYLRANGREDLELYESRLAHDCTVVRPQWYFQRRTVPRLDSQLIEHARFLWDIAQEIAQARKDERHPKNHKACMYQKTPCKFLGICSGYDTPESDRWRQKKQVHNELPIIDGDGRDVLTNSRIGTFLLCRRKHFYEYELGIERNREDEDESEALYTGDLMHKGLEAYFNALKGEQADGSNDNCVAPVNEIGTDTGNEAPFYL